MLAEAENCCVIIIDRRRDLSVTNLGHFFINFRKHKKPRATEVELEQTVSLQQGTTGEARSDAKADAAES